MTTGKTIALTKRTFVGKVMSLLFNMLSRLVIAFLRRSKRLLISWLQSPSAIILEPKKIRKQCFHCFPIYLPWSDGTRCHDLRFLNVEFEARENSLSLFPLFLHLFAMKSWDQMPWSSFFECWVLSQLFHSPFSPSSTGSSVTLLFLP